MDKKAKAAPEVTPEVQEAQEKALIDALVSKVSTAQKEFANFSQEQVDKIFKAVAMAAAAARLPLAKAAAEEIVNIIASEQHRVGRNLENAIHFFDK